ncbi:hypothetical protein [Orenia marismortui]|nr:hypothetical protein [Orenia marismortui]
MKCFPINEALEIVENDNPENNLGQFIHQRDLAFIKKAKEIIGF